MSLVYGLAAGLAYGLSTFGGALLMLPLLVFGVGVAVHAALPVALAALALCCAITAGDAARARQCATVPAIVFICAGLPAVAGSVWLVQRAPVTTLVTGFSLLAATVAFLLWHGARGSGERLPPPVALWRAPRRSLTEPMAPFRHWRMVVAGVISGLIAACCGASGGWFAQRLLARQLPHLPFETVGTLALGTCALAVAGAFFGFVLAPAAPGHASGLFVLGAVAGVGFARRVDRPRLRPICDSAIALALFASAATLWIAIVSGWPIAS